MHICYDLRKIELSQHDRPVVTLGTFDGVHLGHKAILQRVVEQAQKSHKKSVLLTYHPHPRQVLNPHQPVRLLTTLEEKIKLIESFGLDEMVVLNFDQALANTEARQFVIDILVKRLSPSHLVVGYDHGFGKNRQGGIALLQEAGEMYGFPVEVISPVKHGEDNISSTKIRKAFQAGDFNSGVRMLGHGYPLQGIVKMGTGLGQKLGFPTCNLKLPEEKLLPPTGIYSCQVKFDSRKKEGMAYIGTKPTLPAQKELSIEVNIFDFKGTLYDQSLLVYLEEWVRADQKFIDLDSLRSQIEQDEKTIREKQKRS
jgi:riboflavin kinase / FMN adenylyltransferase